VAQREATTDEVLASIRRQPFGGVKAELFKWSLQYVHKFLVLRDDERHYMDRVTMAKKRAFQEVGRRLVERGKLVGDDDFYFLAEHELWELLDGAEPNALTRAKIVNRRDMFNRFNARLEAPPAYLRGNTPVGLDAPSDDDASGGLRGTGTSRGTVTGRARIVADLKDIGVLEKGDILICNATDPGWASVFALISGLVMETGGMLAHGSCLSREYGLPAVTLPNAIQRIPDGATITVVGDTGAIEILDEPAADDSASETPSN
jgi:pyruvate,water dikinase